MFLFLIVIFVKNYQMATSLRLGGIESTSFINDLHNMLMQLKVTHYNTTGYAEHKALGEAYDALNDLADSISEKLMGYTGTRISTIVLGTVSASSASSLAESIKSIAATIITYATTKKYEDLSNLGQELSGIGAELKYLSTLK
jgi:DNA-binding ferritin-like protein